MKSSKSAKMPTEFDKGLNATTLIASNSSNDVIDLICPTTLNDCDKLFSPLYNLPSVPSLVPIQCLATSKVSDIDPDASPNRKALHVIVSKYFRTPIQCKKVVNALDSLNADESITLNDLSEKTPANSRPSKEQRDLMLQELIDSKLVLVSQKGRSFIITKRV